MVSYEEMVDNLKSAYAILFTATENNVGLSTDETFYCQCSVKDALSFIEEQKPKKRESRAMLPCTCGGKLREHWYGIDSESLVCKRCGFSVIGKNNADVIRRWNEAVKQDG